MAAITASGNFGDQIGQQEFSEGGFICLLSIVERVNASASTIKQYALNHNLCIILTIVSKIYWFVELYLL